MATAKRLAEELIEDLSCNPFAMFTAVMTLLMIGWWEFWPTLSHGTAFVFEDSNGLPFTGPFPQTLRPASWIWAILRLTDPWQYHLLNLGIHALTSVMVAAVAAQLWPTFDRFVPIAPRWLDPKRWEIVRDRNELAWACGAIFWLHPLAVPAVGYASALPEMLVCLGAVTLMWTLLQDRTWYWLCAAGAILIVTLNVKSSGIGVLLLPVVSLIVRPFRWRGRNLEGWILIGLFYAALVAVSLEDRVDFVRVSYPWHRWPEEMLPMAAQAWILATQSIVPLGIGFQMDPLWPVVGGLCWLVLLVAVAVSLVTSSHRSRAFAILYVLALITVRLTVPASNWQDRAPEMWYTQQWYPALPGMVWLLVGFVAGDASRGEPSAASPS